MHREGYLSRINGMKATQGVENRTPTKENAISMKNKVIRSHVRSTKQPHANKRLCFKREKAIRSRVKSTEYSSCT